MKSLEPNGNARDLKCFGIGLLHSNGCNITRGLLHFVLSRRDKAQPQAWLGGKFSFVSTIFPLKCQCLEDFPATFDDRIYGFVCIYIYSSVWDYVRNHSKSIYISETLQISGHPILGQRDWFPPILCSDAQPGAPGCRHRPQGTAGS